tara:strand:- start:2053 stop:3165 length:1113 start_codon:yes stop_codon:yes gene_type:complete
MFSNTFKNKNILITGSSGFKGSWLSLWLKKLEANVWGISNELPSKPSMFEELGIENIINKNYIINLGDVGNGLDKIFDEVRPDIVFHLAAQPIVSKSYQNPVDTIHSNVMGTTNILNSISMQKKQTIGVIITSDKCYDNLELQRGYKEDDVMGGKDIYSGSKGAAELIFKSYYHSFFKNHDFNSLIASARAGNVIGGGDWGANRIIPDAVTSWSRNKTINIRNPKSTRPWQHVLEPLSGYLSLANKLINNPNINGQSYNFGPDEKNKKNVENLIRNLAKEWNFLDIDKSYQIENMNEFHEAGLLQLDCFKASQELNWEPALSYKQMVTFTSSWYKEFYQNKGGTNMILKTFDQINNYENIALDKNFEWAK